MGAIVYFFGRRSAAKLSAPDALAHLAVLDLNDKSESTPEAV
jgi:hypothetical protein